VSRHKQTRVLITLNRLIYRNQDSAGYIMNIANFIENFVTQIDKVEEGTYNAATNGTYEPAKSWIPGNPLLSRSQSTQMRRLDLLLLLYAVHTVMNTFTMRS
jgi:hypothetical protein